MMGRAGVVAASLFVVACGPKVAGDGGTDPGTGSESVDSSESGEGGSGGDVALPINKEVDVLFVIDNSGSMGGVQARLSESFPAFVEVLEAPDVRASYRIGVTTTDNGNPWCGSTSPEAGNLLLSSCRGRTGEFVFNGNPPADATAVACTDLCRFDEIATVPTTTEHDPEPRPRPWLESTDGVTNLAEQFDGTPTPAEAFQCFGPQGISGCGFESHLESMYKAILRSNQEGEDEHGFMRSGAILAVVIVTDEIDCSANSEHQSIFLGPGEGGNQVFWSDPGASAPTSAVCWNAGVECLGGPGSYDTCYAVNKDVNGNLDVLDDDAVLHPVSRYVELLQDIEYQKQEQSPDREVLISLIAGVPPGYESGLAELSYQDAVSATEQNDFGIGAGCVNNAVEPPFSARPPVREREVAEAFQVGERRNVYSVCGDDYSPALGAIADAIRDQIRPACMPQCVADTDPITQSLQPSCQLVQRAPLPDGGVDEQTVPPCSPGGGLPEDADVCYVTLVGDARSDFCAEQGWNLELQLVRRPGVPAPGGAVIEATCQLSQNKNVDCPELP